MKKEDFGVVTFESTSHAIRGEKSLKEENIKIKTIPTPREITSSCGLSIRFNLEDLNTIENVIESNKLAISGIYKMIKEGLKYTVEKIN
ncbi:MAG TPA: DUF3343 domain-containing protein [Tissierellales bacterium]|nr:DUF3343 domain-containing protein [Tissierellales bacterium]